MTMELIDKNEAIKVLQDTPCGSAGIKARMVGRIEKMPTIDKMQQLVDRLKTERMSQAEFEQYAKEHGYIISTTNIIEQIRDEIVEEQSRWREDADAEWHECRRILRIIDKYRGDKNEI